MTHLVLIRHGQASFGSRNYDRLSDLGRQQAAILAEYFFKHNIQFDMIIHGQMSRQAETAAIIAQSKHFSGELRLEQSANEFDSDSLIAHYLPKLARESKDFHQIIDAKEPWFSKAESFEIIFRALIKLWQSDEHCPFESWLCFRQRTIELLNHISQHHCQHKKIVLVTSGGLISATMQSILGFDNRVFMDMNLTINNASLSEIKIQPLSSPITELTEKAATESTNEPRSDHIIKEKPTHNRKKINAKLLSFNNITPLLMSGQKELITRK